MTATKLKLNPKVSCKDCQHYPDDCGYWDKKYRAAKGDSGFLSASAYHGCLDFKKRDE